MQDSSSAFTPSSIRATAGRRDAFGLAAALDAYAAASTRLVEGWFDPQAYAECTERLEAIRAHGLADPALSALTLQLFIAHCEVLSILWRHAVTGDCAEGIATAQERHALALGALCAALATLQARG